MSQKHLLVALFVLLAVSLTVVAVYAQRPNPTPPKAKAPTALAGTAFTYQGQLKNNGALVNGSCNLAFRLYDDVSAGSQIGSAITQTIPITNGLFTTQLNAGNEFGANAFNGDARWLEMRTSCPSGGSFTTLSPRQAVSPAPYALTSLYTAYKNVLVVTASGGHYNSIAAAVNAITDNTTTNRYLIWVGPGIYNERVTMKPFVDIEGAGELTTKITFAGSATDTTGTVVGANEAELRFITAENTGSAANAIAIFNSGTAPRLNHVTASASGGTNNIGIHNEAASPIMKDVTASASGGTYSVAVRNYFVSSPTMADVTASASGGTNNYGVFNFSSSSPIMTNISTTASGGADNRGVYSNSSSSPKMMQVTATASGGTNNYGVINTVSSSPLMKNINASAAGGASGNYGVYNYSSSSPTMINVSASAAGGITATYGVYNELLSAPTMTDVTANASGGTFNVGVQNIGSTVSYLKMTNVTSSASGGTDNIGVGNYDSNAMMTNVTASASGGTNSNSAVRNSANSIVIMTNLVASASDGFSLYAVYNDNSNADINNSVLSATGSGSSFRGIYNISGTANQVTVNNSQIRGATNTITNFAGFTTLVGVSKLSGGAVSISGGTVTCAGVYDEAYVFSASTCP